ncbi:MAG TPA: cupin domain-containing protein [Puia sp.]|nr:cupin domain-containing protein [Puia sp.]
MKRGKIIHAVLVISFIIVVFAIPGSIKAQQGGFGRTELQRHDLSAAGIEMVQVRVNIEPGVEYPRHTHPGEEIIYVLEGELEYQIEGRAPVILKAGEPFFIPYGKIHSVKNIGSVKGVELATYIVEKGKPLVFVIK